MPQRIQLKRTAGWRMPPDTVRVTRPGPFGNPFRIGNPAPYRMTHRGQLRYSPNAPRIMETAEIAVLYFGAWIRTHRNGRSMFSAVRAELPGKNLACFCPLGAACHADILLEIANGK